MQPPLPGDRSRAVAVVNVLESRRAGHRPRWQGIAPARPIDRASQTTGTGSTLASARDRMHANQRRRAGRIAVALVGVAGVLLISRSGALAPRDSTERVVERVVERGRGPVPASYVGLHIHHAGAGTAWPSAAFASWRLWDAYVAWPWLEPSRGAWQWEIADRLVTLAGEHQIEVLLPLGLSPTWASARPTEPSAYGRPGLSAEPADLGDWRRYVETVASRYAGRVHLYEIWNEPNLAEFYTGDVAAMVRLCREAYAIVKRIDPAARVVSPAATGAAGVPWLDRFLAAGGAGCFDVVGFHFYVMPDAAETIVPLIARVQDVMQARGVGARPLWNTETGWYVARAPHAAGADHPGALSESLAAATVARALVLARAAGVERFYWYAWDNENTGLADRDGVARAPGRALAEVERWLVGAQLDGCRRVSSGAWLCGLTREGRGQWIVWHPGGRADLPNPPRWRIATRRDLGGTVQPVRADAPTIEIGPAPQLLEPRP